ncbi:MAG: bifunctional ADP-dependent NAD(P)H-hydrate dehydratase/NAD(P)H-hydrate epimerase, partial [Clostridia bacterium]|nr:bifunctional ADP-dependent NAD(P)H-hydrate dehydratase/NAD(P)H-hydrate epimerase [Clostridia bacterium]
TGTPALAKGGSGDVLSGLLAGLVARIPVFEACCSASYLLGRAGELSAERLGEYSSDATDVIDCIPAAIANL